MTVDASIRVTSVIYDIPPGSSSGRQLAASGVPGEARATARDVSAGPGYMS